MSFIFDALKKSEADRLNKDTPGFSNVPDKAQEKSASHWIWIVVVLIVVNVSVLTLMFMKPDRVPDAAPVSPPTEAAVVAPQLAAVSNTATRRTASLPAESAASATPVAEPLEESMQESPQTASSNRPGRSFEVTESFASFNELRVQGVLNLPDLHLDIHVYSNQPEERFVFINMSKYTASSTLAEGPVVAEITPDGVILDYRGTAFLLPRE